MKRTKNIFLEIREKELKLNQEKELKYERISITNRDK